MKQRESLIYILYINLYLDGAAGRGGMQHLYRTFGTGIAKNINKHKNIPVIIFSFSAVLHMQVSVIFKSDYLGWNTKQKELWKTFTMHFSRFLG
jgi:hypothetical protein